MNQEQRDALRAKHHVEVLGGPDCAISEDGSYFDFCVICCDSDDTAPYPCELIQVLDAWEATL